MSIHNLAITEENDTPEIYSSRVGPAGALAPSQEGSLRGDNDLCDGAFPESHVGRGRTSPAELRRSSEAPPFASAARTILAGAGMVSEETSERQVSVAGNDQLVLAHETPPSQPTLVSEAQSLRYAERLSLWESFQALAKQGLSQVDAARQLGVSNTKLSRMAKQVAQHGLDGLKDKYHNCGRLPSLAFTDAEFQALASIYLKTNRTADAGSMQTACKFFALAPETRERTAHRYSFFIGARPASALLHPRLETHYARTFRRSSQARLPCHRSFLRTPWDLRSR
jgi:hypothetical protein